MHLHRRGGVGIDGGLGAEIHHRREGSGGPGVSRPAPRRRLSLWLPCPRGLLCADGAGSWRHRVGMAPDPAGVDAFLGEELAAVDAQIGGGPAQPAAEAPAAHHPAAEAVGALQQAACLVEGAGGQGAADAAAAHPLAIDMQHRHHRDGDAMACPQPCQIAHVAAAARPEAEVVAHRHLAGLQAARQHLRDEGLRAQRGQLGIEGHQHQLSHPQRLQQFQLLGGQIEPQPRLAMQHLARVGPEAHHRRHWSVLPRFVWISLVWIGFGLIGRAPVGGDRRDHPPVALMQTVETSQGDGGRTLGVLGIVQRNQRRGPRLVDPPMASLEPAGPSPLRPVPRGGSVLSAAVAVSAGARPRFSLPTPLARLPDAWPTDWICS